ncbi:MBL fold metallo-hydrolase [Paracoccus sanguinis]|uniref:MBL fold metallo-hydrolase n=1 Tax=Paracoccus sanguinis TaxID=1545044 RepID=UPI0014512F1E|nr:MBL fold metallo-hydrolase [Paracoccus sanguinis]QJD17140.1 MBL fold metallo-hydrolase [Paracoccus sanguinis]
MRITRRLLLTGAALALGTTALPLRRAWAVTTAEFGGMRIDSLSDGWLELPADMTLSVLPEAERAALGAQFGLTPGGVVQSPLNVTLLRHDGRVVLFDVGSGPDFMPTAGKLAEALSALDLTPDDVTDVVFTHAHPDHLWGVLDDFDEPLFPAARMQMGAQEHRFWTDPATPAALPEAQQSFAAGAARRLEALGEAVTTFEAGAEVLPGVVAVATPGHTPGHTSFAVGTPAEGVFVTGDFITMPLSFARPEIGAATDHEPAQAAETRKATLARLADEGWRILGYHLPDGGLGQVERDGDAYRFVPG